MPTIKEMTKSQVTQAILQMLKEVSEEHKKKNTVPNEKRNLQMEKLTALANFVLRQSPLDVRQKNISDKIENLRKVHTKLDNEILYLEPYQRESFALPTLIKLRDDIKSDMDELTSIRDMLPSNNASLDERKRLSLVGLLLEVKEQIELEYSGLVNKIVDLVKKNDPTNSGLYVRICKLLEGIDEQLIADAKNAYKEFANKINSTYLIASKFAYHVLPNIKPFEDESYKKEKLKHVETDYKDVMPKLITEPDFAVFENGIIANNKTLRDMNEEEYLQYYANKEISSPLLFKDSKGEVKDLPAPQNDVEMKSGELQVSKPF